MWFGKQSFSFLAAIGLLSAPVYAQTIIPDPAGDAVAGADVIAISGGFLRTNLYLSATFRNGSLNPTNLGFMFGLDTDQNPNTGVGPQVFFPRGAEFSISFSSTRDQANASVKDEISKQVVGYVPVAFGSNTLAITVPLALVHSANGIMSFGFLCGLPAGGSFQPFDLVPDSANNGPLGGPTSIIPELAISRQGTTAIISWPAAATNYVLEASSNLAAFNNWGPLTNPVGIVGSDKVVQDSMASPIKVYRLRK